MCGIVGFTTAAGHDPAAAKRTAQAMADLIRHRGPDGEGYYADAHAALGHRRLSIIDLAGGGQPMFNEDGTLVVVFNGEIYNYKALHAELTARGHTFATDSDTELGCADGILRLEAQRADTAAHSQGIVNVVVAGHAQLDVGKLLTQFEDVELEEAGLVLADVDGAEAGLLLDAEAQHRAVDGVDNVHRVFIVHVEDDRAGQQRKLLERELELPF